MGNCRSIHDNRSLVEKVKWKRRVSREDTYKRYSVISDGDSVVMSTPSATCEPWEGVLAPGKYLLSDLVLFPDREVLETESEGIAAEIKIKHEVPVPRHAQIRVERSSWRSAAGSERESGTLELSPEALATVVPIEIATRTLLDFYDCTLIDLNSKGKIKLHDTHVFQDFTYAKDYFKRYTQGCSGLEFHDFVHVECPLDNLNKSGMFLLGKWNADGNALFLTAFRIPQMHALYVPGDVVHSNDYLCGTWRTMLSWTSKKPIDHVKLSCSSEMTLASTRHNTTVSLNIEPCNCGPDLRSSAAHGTSCQSTSAVETNESVLSTSTTYDPISLLESTRKAVKRKLCDAQKLETKATSGLGEGPFEMHSKQNGLRKAEKGNRGWALARTNSGRITSMKITDSDIDKTSVDTRAIPTPEKQPPSGARIIKISRTLNFATGRVESIETNTCKKRKQYCTQ